MLADYHVHTAFSNDSVYPMEDVVKDAISLGMEDICFTDHVDYGPAVTAIADKNVIRYLQHFFLKFAFILLPPLMMITLCYILLPPALLHISLPKTANQEVNNKKY